MCFPALYILHSITSPNVKKTQIYLAVHLQFVVLNLVFNDIYKTLSTREKNMLTIFTQWSPNQVIIKTLSF